MCLLFIAASKRKRVNAYSINLKGPHPTTTHASFQKCSQSAVQVNSSQVCKVTRDSQVIPKWSLSDSQVIPKWFQSDSQVIPKLFSSDS